MTFSFSFMLSKHAVICSLGTSDAGSGLYVVTIFITLTFHRAVTLLCYSFLSSLLHLSYWCNSSQKPQFIQALWRVSLSLQATKPAERPPRDLVSVLLPSCVTIDWESARQWTLHRCNFGCWVFDHIPKINLEVRPSSRPLLLGHGWFFMSVSLSVATAVVQASCSPACL